jgi:hypothetical protein
VSRWVAVGGRRNTFANSGSSANFNGVTNTNSYDNSHAKTNPHTYSQQAQILQH